MTDAQQREVARQFFYRWRDKGNEDEHARSFWIELLSDILGVENVTKRLDFEKKVIGPDGNTKRIDVYIPETHVLIEQKSIGIVLDKPQAGHNGMTPYEQAKMYDNGLPFDEKARWIITSNFAEIWLYDMNQKKPEASVVKLSLADLPTKFHVLDFLVNTEAKKITQEMEISLKAGEIVGELYDAFHKQYKNPDDPESLKSLNKLCVRLVFLCYAEDAGILGKKAMFHDYMEQYATKDMRKALINLFEVLNQKPEERDQYITDDLAAFPFVNGGLFEDEKIEIPMFTEEIREMVLNKASAEFDWSGISPTIFGAVFESTLNPETRRSGGMHYTSIENIHKVIDPLFLNDLKTELNGILSIGVIKDRQKKLRAYQEKLASLKFMDPAAGSGNFLTETYISIRRLENKTIQELERGQGVLAFADPIKVSISQFYGIEINDFAVTVAKTALWIAESQMMKETEGIVHMDLDFLPLKTNANIVEGNALQIDWKDVVDKNELNYCYGNPPFVGTKMMSKHQKEDTKRILGKWKNYGTLDYVACWYIKAAEYIDKTSIRCAFVSTNSITQGEQVAPLWKPMFEDLNVHIDFAYRTFQWDSEASIKAHVHCVIIGFSQATSVKKHLLFEEGKITEAENINPYLVNAPTVYIESRKTPLSKDAPIMYIGCEMKDDGYYTLSEEEKNQVIADYPGIEQFIHPYYMGKDLINRKPRYCFWLKKVNPVELKKYPFVVERIKKVKQFRLDCPSPDTNRYAEFPMLPVRLRYYSEDRDTDALAIPKVSSQNRRYIPMDVINAEAIAGSKLFLVPSVGLYSFGVMTSNVHMAWVRTVCGRLKSDYSYASNVVYNTFPWPSPSEVQKNAIEATAQAILDARALYPNATLADLYDPITMPKELQRAHARNDAAVMKAYGMPIKETDEAGCVAWLMRLYQERLAEMSDSTGLKATVK